MKGLLSKSSSSKNQNTGLSDSALISPRSSQSAYVSKDVITSTQTNRVEGDLMATTTKSTVVDHDRDMIVSKQETVVSKAGNYNSVLSAQTLPGEVGGSFSITSLGMGEVSASEVHGKVVHLGAASAFTINHPEVCIAQEKLLIKHEPIVIRQTPVVIQPETISIPQQPFMWQPEPIAIPLPPLTIQPEPIVIERPDLIVTPDSYIVHRPNLVLNSAFHVQLTHEVAATTSMHASATSASASSSSAGLMAGSASSASASRTSSGRSMY